ncbi:hypothetical protein EIP86_001164 [Pleurotus ostreatoroseus]|nr:hypothetical protein EIP86_001164 [Pleurotus ostreatoroseus]
MASAAAHSPPGDEELAALYNQVLIASSKPIRRLPPIPGSSPIPPPPPLPNMSQQPVSMPVPGPYYPQQPPEPPSKPRYSGGDT